MLIVGATDLSRVVRWYFNQHVLPGIVFTERRQLSRPRPFVFRTTFYLIQRRFTVLFD